MRRCVECRFLLEKEWRCGHCGHEPDPVNGILRFAPELDGSAEGFREAFFDDLIARERANFWFRNRNRVLIDVFRGFFPDASTFLEIGCGNGFVLEGLSKAGLDLQLHGSDIFSAPLAAVQRRVTDAVVYQMDARAIPFRDEYDVIGAFDVIEHVADDRAVLSEMVAAARPGGGVVLTVPQHVFLWSAADEYACHKRRYSRRELVEKMRAAGLEILFVSSFVATTFPLMLLSRLWPRREYDPRSEFDIPRWVDRLLEAALAVERPLLARRHSLPFGGSLLAVGRIPL